jgi:hypothetical protein
MRAANALFIGTALLAAATTSAAVSSAPLNASAMQAAAHALTACGDFKSYDAVAVNRCALTVGGPALDHALTDELWMGRNDGARRGTAWQVRVLPLSATAPRQSQRSSQLSMTLFLNLRRAHSHSFCSCFWMQTFVCGPVASKLLGYRPRDAHAAASLDASMAASLSAAARQWRGVGVPTSSRSWNSNDDGGKNAEGKSTTAANRASAYGRCMLARRRVVLVGDAWARQLFVALVRVLDPAARPATLLQLVAALLPGASHSSPNTARGWSLPGSPYVSSPHASQAAAVGHARALPVPSNLTWTVRSPGAATTLVYVPWHLCPATPTASLSGSSRSSDEAAEAAADDDARVVRVVRRVAQDADAVVLDVGRRWSAAPSAAAVAEVRFFSGAFFLLSS